MSNHHENDQRYSAFDRALLERIDSRLEYAIREVKTMGIKFDTLMEKINHLEHKSGNDAAEMQSLHNQVEKLTIERDEANAAATAATAAAATAVAPVVDGATPEELDAAIAKLDAMLPVDAAPAA
jgi:peptidoglycan hydrolase CwlO-like protein